AGVGARGNFLELGDPRRGFADVHVSSPALSDPAIPSAGCGICRLVYGPNQRGAMSFGPPRRMRRGHRGTFRPQLICCLQALAGVDECSADLIRVLYTNPLGGISPCV